MATSKHIDLICVVITVLALLLTVLFMNGAALGIGVISDGDGESEYFTDNDLAGDWSDETAVRITLTGQGATASGGAYFMDGMLHIVYAGRYVLTGELEGGIVIDVDKSEKVWLLLDGVSIENPDGAAIQVEQAKKVFITLAEGTENTLISAAFTDSSSKADGAIYSRDDLTINGSGSLTVKSACHGIVGNDDLVITGGKLNITAAQDGIHAHDSIRICNADITVNAGDDGIHASNDDETAWLYVESGTITIPSCYEGLEAINITIAGGVIDIRPTDDGINANGQGRNSVINITGGDITIINETGRDADGLDSNGSLYISGGNIFISVNTSSCALDYGSENGGVCEISGGVVIAAGGSAMAESFDAASPQGFVASTVRGSAGSAVVLKDASGRILLHETIPVAFAHLVLSVPELTKGDAVTLSVDGSETTLTVSASTSSAGFGGMFGGMGGGRGEQPGDQGGMSGSFGGRGDKGDRGGQMGDIPTGGDIPGDGDVPDGGDLPGFGGMFGGRGDRDGQPGELPGGDDIPDSGIWGDRGNRGGVTNRQPAASDTQSTTAESIDPGTLLLTLVSALVLAAGIFIAMKVKH